MSYDPANESPTSNMGPRQIWCPRRIPVATLTGAGGDGGTVKIACLMPDSRLRVRFDLVAVPDLPSVTPAAMIAGRGITIWPYGAVDDEVQGRPRIPVSEVIVGITQAAPDPVPHSAGLGGWSREFNSAGDAVEAIITIPAQVEPAQGSGQLWLQARVQPNDWAILPWEQWDEIRRACGIQVLEGPIVT